MLTLLGVLAGACTVTSATLPQQHASLADRRSKATTVPPTLTSSAIVAASAPLIGGDAPWSCDVDGDDLQVVILRRETTGSWKKHLPAGAEGESVVRDAEHRACAFVDAHYAWVLGLVGEMPDRKLVVYRTTDGGVTWSSSGLGDDHYTDWPVAPRAELTFQDPMNGRLTTIDPPVHHNGHVETTITYSTEDGGRTWRQIKLGRRSFEKSGGPG